jgi:hypothetical protein
MFRKLFGQGRKSQAAGTFYVPYNNDAANKICNLLFCDDPTLFSKGADAPDPLGAVLSETTDRESLERVGNDLDVESRVRVLAFNRLRAMKLSVPAKRLLGTIIEFPLEQGLDTLAVFTDGCLRYINQTGQNGHFRGLSPSACRWSRGDPASVLVRRQSVRTLG